MAAGGKSFDPLNFVEQSKYWLDSTHPNWKEVITSPLDQAVETICIPDAPDVLPNRRHDTEQNAVAKYSSPSERMNEQIRYRQNLVGQGGEDKLIRAFRQLKLGGILISGLDTKEFIMKMNPENSSIKEKKAKCAKWKKKIGNFECDAIFLHHQLGIFIIEIKGCENEKIKAARFNKAVTQLHRSIYGMKEVFRRVTGASECPFQIRGVICFPNIDVNPSSDDYIDYGDYIVMGKSKVESSNFKNCWLPTASQLYSSYSPRHTLEQGTLKPISEDLHAFIACITGYRSAKFTSLMLNALEIYRMIDQQDFSRKRTGKQEIASDYVWHHGKAIILNSEQLRAVECSEQHVIISGPPGTGKTTVLLLRALAAAKVEKTGRVMVYSGTVNDYLRRLFKKLVDSNGSDGFKREIVITVDKGQPWATDDDVFFDEAPIHLSKYLSKRISVRDHLFGWSRKGTSTIAVTGWLYPEKLATEMTEESTLFNFHHIQLKTVIRGTLSIISEWQRHFPDQYLTYGHNVQGAPVERITVNDKAHLLSTIEEIVRNLLNGISSTQVGPDNSFFHTVAPEHIAIISSKNNFTIKSYLITKGIPCNDNYRQIYDRNVVAVTFPNLVLSFDWPVVICVTDYREKSEHLIACSRCISKLYTILGLYPDFYSY